MQDDVKGAPTERPVESGTSTAIKAGPETIVVMSGKGGVGKSTVAVNMAVALAQRGYKVGLADVDIHGPSIPTMLNLHNVQVFSNADNKMLPLQLGDLHQLEVISLGFLLEREDAPVIWRGPLKHSLIDQFLNDVAWGKLDFLVVDCPPGTGDEPLSVVQQIKGPAHALLVTTPQQVAAVDVSRSINFCKEVKLPIVGLIENMSGFECPHCHEVTNIFPAGGGEKLSSAYGIRFLGAIPILAEIGLTGDSGVPIVAQLPESSAAQVYRLAAATVAEELLAGRKI